MTPSSRNESAGECPNCGVVIRRHDVLIEWKTASGRSVFADCPGCGEVVRPA